MRTAMMGLLAVFAATAAMAQAPVQKVGSCPSGYHQSSNYCIPSSSSAAPALPKVGSCPSGYHQSEIGRAHV